MTTAPPKQPNALLDIVLTVVAPSFVLDYLSPPERLGPFYALVVSMLFPVAFGAWCWWKKHAWNVFSILGLVTVLLSGGLYMVGYELSHLSYHLPPDSFVGRFEPVFRNCCRSIQGSENCAVPMNMPKNRGNSLTGARPSRNYSKP